MPSVKSNQLKVHHANQNYPKEFQRFSLSLHTKI